MSDESHIDFKEFDIRHEREAERFYGLKAAECDRLKSELFAAEAELGKVRKERDDARGLLAIVGINIPEMAETVRERISKARERLRKEEDELDASERINVDELRRDAKEEDIADNQDWQEVERHEGGR